jgi:tRNA (mo5U34)-methyltransferase
VTLQSHGLRRKPADEVERTIHALAPWFHNLHLPSGHETAPDHPLGDFPRFKWRQLERHLPEDMRGWRCLDIGCNAGFYSFELARRGAWVLGVDTSERYLAQAEWARSLCGLSDRVELRRLGVYELARLRERFDLVLFMGLLYHLRYPLLGLDVAAEKAARLLVVQTMTMPGPHDGRPVHPPDLPLGARGRLLHERWPKAAFIEQSLAGDPTNWWAPDSACVEAMVRSTGMRVVARAGHELWVCEPVAPLPAAVAAELEEATGRGG